MGVKAGKIDLSVIVPVYNAARYLPTCLDSLMDQGDLSLEIILVDDGSTDGSETIADRYALRDRRIRVIHQENGGASSARNTGLALAKGEYLFFLDSDDWIEPRSLPLLHQLAVRWDAEMVMGNVWQCDVDGGREKLFEAQSETIGGSFTGKEAFVWLTRQRLYLPMPVKYIYRRSLLDRLGARFQEGIMHEDELWMPLVLVGARKVYLSNVAHYNYRRNLSSVMNSTARSRRLRSLSRVSGLLFEYSDRWDFSGPDGVLKSWWYVNAYRVYSWAMMLLPSLRDSSWLVPESHLSRLWRDCREMDPESLSRCRAYWSDAATGLRRYVEWRVSDWVAPVPRRLAEGKRLLLIYNMNKEWTWCEESTGRILSDWTLTTDRRYLRRADVVVFYLPTLYQELESDLEKPEGQLWIYGFSNSEADDAILHDQEITALFDGLFCFPQEEEETPFPIAAVLRALGMETNK